MAIQPFDNETSTPELQKELGNLEVIVVGRKDEGSVALIVRLVHVSFCVEQRLRQIHIVRARCRKEVESLCRG